MKFGARGSLLLLLPVALLAIASTNILAQTSPGTLRGQVTDQTGAVVPQATVSVAPETGTPVTATADKQGNYEVKGLSPGMYTVSATAKDLSSEAQAVTIEPGQVRQLNLPLAIDVQKEVIQVQEEAPTVSVSPSEDTAGTLIIKGKDLESLSDDPDELQTELEALAGPSAGPNGGQIYIDGFTGGQLPPKSSIREIRINQNPFSAEFDKLGYGRIEIFTKPGTDQYHGQIFFNDNNAVLNTRNPFLGDAEQPGYNTTLINGNVGGPLGKSASFFINFEQRNINDLAIVNAQVLNPCPSNVPCTLNAAVTNPSTRTNFSPRLDYQLSKDNTLVVRYQYLQSSQTNQGVGQFSLASQGYNTSSTEQSIQITDTQVISARTVNETRFQYIRDRGDQIAQIDSPVVAVPQAFVSGGNPIGNSTGHADHYELQNYTSMVLGTHSVKFGGRVRVQRDAVDYDNNFNGTFLFNSLTCSSPTEGCYSPTAAPSQ
ncbi:MAG: carboxypeptidase-like regulatory domain-containing protein, partial [Terriglobales bacterium]